MTDATHTGFLGMRRVASGALVPVALAVQAALADAPDATPLVFDDTTGEAVSLNLHGTPEQLRARLERRLAREAAAEAEPPRSTGPGRPKLGVVAREVTLLPRHWAWLEEQPGGISVTLRALVEQARKANAGRDAARRARDAAHRFMTVLAGDAPGFEEASRALFARDWDALDAHVRPWPRDVREHARRLVAVARRRAEEAGAAPPGR